MSSKSIQHFGLCFPSDVFRRSNEQLEIRFQHVGAWVLIMWLGFQDMVYDVGYRTPEVGENQSVCLNGLVHSKVIESRFIFALLHPWKLSICNDLPRIQLQLAFNLIFFGIRFSYPHVFGKAVRKQSQTRLCRRWWHYEYKIVVQRQPHVRSSQASCISALGRFVSRITSREMKSRYMASLSDSLNQSTREGRKGSSSAFH